ncbi:hypothetical protein AV903_05995 [Erwinia tracheiphila]|uniref:Uncharacterized protein n=1 Tax=Erwinia tracheiphila TaxID=65700 RepID=A0A345CQN1_9GAMM|nr:hypothetical protein AV903_05995 [Erwinia tracheiphila]
MRDALAANASPIGTATSTVRPIFHAVSSSAPNCFASAAAALYVAVRVCVPRPHQYNGGLTPNESERLFWENSEAVDSFV